jgi:hypothetical protein
MSALGGFHIEAILSTVIGVLFCDATEPVLTWLRDGCAKSTKYAQNDKMPYSSVRCRVFRQVGANTDDRNIVYGFH